jgi:hypothetical protein
MILPNIAKTYFTQAIGRTAGNLINNTVIDQGQNSVRNAFSPRYYEDGKANYDNILDLVTDIPTIILSIK